MKKLIVNADDFGYRVNINKGIIDSHINGIVTSTSLLVKREGTEDALNLAHKTPSLGIGLHLDLDRFFAIDHNRGIAQEWTTPKPSLNHIQEEIEHQVNLFFSFGLIPDHLNSHHHAHLNPEVFPIACQIAKQYKIPFIRLFRKYFSDDSVFYRLKKMVDDADLKTAGHFIEGWYQGNIDEPYDTAELMTHPGYEEPWREAELAHCCQPQLREYLTKNHIELVRFSNLT